MRKLSHIITSTLFIIALVAGMFCYTNNAQAQTGSKNQITEAQNQNLKSYKDIMAELYKNRELGINELITKAAIMRLETPYVASTLERGEKEELYVNINETDCILFVESCLALAQTAISGDTTYTNFCKKIQDLRYRNGVVDGYPSRMHYTSEWLLQAEKNGYLSEQSKEIANTPLNQKFSYMTEKSDSYKHLKGNAANIAKIKKAEDYLNAHEYWYIPNDQIAKYAHKLQTGDIFGFCTSTKGLDLSHVGIVYWDNGRLTFIHASYGEKKVVIETKTLEEYAKSGKSTIGIRVARAK